MTKIYDVIGIGSALLDITFEVDDDILKRFGLSKGTMILIDHDKNLEILNGLKDIESKTFPGGSSANTIAGVGVLGGRPLFIAKVGNDSYGKIYETKTKEYNVFSDFKKQENNITGNTITFITPDYDRTFAVNLGASLFLNNNDIDEEKIKQAKLLHIEGYLVQDPSLKQVLIHALKLAKKNDLLVSIDLCDSGLIKNNLDFLKTILKEYVDIVFVNESEAKAFTNKDEREALDEFSNYCDISVVKLGNKGSMIKSKGNVYNIPSYDAKVVNTNGAGDMYAAGVLYGLTNGLDIEKAGNLGSYAASLVVQSVGARIDDEFREKLSLFLSNL